MLRAEFEFDAIGTHWGIDIQDSLSREEKLGVVEKIQTRIAQFDKTYSRFRSDSIVSEMSKSTGVYTLPSDAEPLLTLYKELYELTGGAFTPLIGGVLEDAGYDKEYSLIPKQVTPPPAWDDVLEYRQPQLLVKSPVRLDFGAAGKGYLIDIVSSVLRENGASSYCIDAGGDILYRNLEGKMLRVGLEHPEDFSQVIGILYLLDQSICGSAGSRRAWDIYHHTINPHTLSSPKHILATWAVANTTMLADALATCLYFVPPEELAGYNFEYLIMFADHSIKKSSGFSAEIFVS